METTRRGFVEAVKTCLKSRSYSQVAPVALSFGGGHCSPVSLDSSSLSLQMKYPKTTCCCRCSFLSVWLYLPYISALPVLQYLHVASTTLAVADGGMAPR